MATGVGIPDDDASPGPQVTGRMVRVEVPVVWEGGTPADFPGRALGAWFYGEVARRDERVAAALHDTPGAKSFSIAVVPGPSGTGHLLLRIAGAGQVASHVESIGSAFSRALLDGRYLTGCGEKLVTSKTGLEMIQEHLPGDRAQAVRLEFLTPAAFHSRGMTMPLPVPDLVFGSLLERWLAWSEVGLEGGARAVVSECAAIRRHRIQTVSVRMQGRLTSFLGWAEFTLIKPHPAYAGLLALLGEFARYSGVGQKTGMGMGAVSCTTLVPSSTLGRPPRAPQPQQD